MNSSSPIKKRVVETALNKKGFDPKDGDHNFFYLYVNGKKTSIFTKTSHSHKEVSIQLINQMARQLKLTSSQFREFIRCTISEEKYIEILKSKGEISL